MSEVNQREGLNLPKCTLKEFFDDLEGKLAMLTGLVNYEEFGLTLKDIRKPMLVIGPPGIGKTCGIISSIEELNKKLPANRKLGFKKILLGQTVVGSLSGIPVARPDGSVVRIQIPDLPNPAKDGEYGVLFLDEITTADEMQIQPALGLADDSRSLGEYTLPEHWIVVGAGNGPDCTNFVRLDDMTISRFVAYDIAYKYQSDWRGYAHSKGVDENIIAFLNFSPDACIRVESEEMDSAGKLFPCPRTWERLSVELNMRKAMRRPVGYDDMINFSGRIVGKKAGTEFAAFMAFHKNLGYDADKILAGTEKKPAVGMRSEEFHIILQAVIKKCTALLRDTKVGVADYPEETYVAVANAIRWLLAVNDVDKKVTAIIEMLNDLPDVSRMMQDADFCEMCPEIDDFFNNYASVLSANQDYIMEQRRH